MAYPAKTKNANATKRAFMHFAGTEDKIARLYCDNAKDWRKQQQLSSNGALIPRHHTDILRTVSQNDPTDVSLTELEHCCAHLDFRIVLGLCMSMFWHLAIHDESRHFKSCYENRHGALFQGMLVPVGALLSYRPPSGKEGVEFLKFEPRIRKGIFMGYHFHSGGRWSGDYIVLDCETMPSFPGQGSNSD